MPACARRNPGARTARTRIELRLPAQDDPDVILGIRLAGRRTVEAAPVLQRMVDLRAQLEAVVFDQGLRVEDLLLEELVAFLCNGQDLEAEPVGDRRDGLRVPG